MKVRIEFWIRSPICRKCWVAGRVALGRELTKLHEEFFARHSGGNSGETGGSATV